MLNMKIHVKNKTFILSVDIFYQVNAIFVKKRFSKLQNSAT